jgi:hypothetical protein
VPGAWGERRSGHEEEEGGEVLERRGVQRREVGIQRVFL